MPMINVIFDIDETIATGFIEEDISSLERKNPWIKIFKENNYFIHALLPHVIHPGVIELIQTLDRMLNVNIHFFSSGVRARNELLVEKLLRLALGEERYTAIKHKIIVGSREDLIANNKENNEDQFINYGIHHGNYKKSVKRFLNNEEELAWAILVEDDLTYTYYGEEKNILKIPGVLDPYFYSTYEVYKQGMKFKTFLEECWNYFSSVNHIFYTTGILFSAMKMVENKEVATLSDALFKLQFKENLNELKGCKLSFNYALYNELKFYELGLKKLKEVNPNLAFLSSETFFN